MTWQGKRLPSKHPWARAWARRHAHLLGWFWLPCPLCGTEFAGFEWDGAVINDPDYPPFSGRGRGICPWCERDGKGEETLKLFRS